VTVIDPAEPVNPFDVFDWLKLPTAIVDDALVLAVNVCEADSAIALVAPIVPVALPPTNEPPESVIALAASAPLPCVYVPDVMVSVPVTVTVPAPAVKPFDVFPMLRLPAVTVDEELELAVNACEPESVMALVQPTVPVALPPAKLPPDNVMAFADRAPLPCVYVPDVMLSVPLMVIAPAPPVKPFIVLPTLRLAAPIVDEALELPANECVPDT
jgi:hypothetical protein